MRMARSVGDEAPDFQLPTGAGGMVQLRSFRGHFNVLIAFYSFSFDDVCCEDLRRLRDLADRFKAASTQVVAVSCDAPGVLREWGVIEAVPFPLLSDFWPHGEVSDSYGVFDRNLGCARHVVFAVDMGG